jgi:protein-L-isoaspartate(D-aspartate) O-methyltransferase
MELIDPDEARALRNELVEYLVAIGDVRSSRVKNVLLRVPRHCFVPGRDASEAYRNAALSIGWDQTISQPSVVALMTEALELRGDERVLEVGTGSGYQAAVLSLLAAEVFTIEIVVPLAQRAQRILEDLRYTNVHVRAGDGSLGWSEHAPFDRVIVTAATPFVPHRLFEQLADSGMLIAPVGPEWGQELVRFEKHGARFTKTVMQPVAFVPLTHV